MAGADLNKDIAELKSDVREIRDALLGSLEDKTPGLIEQSRVMRLEIDQIKIESKASSTQITEVTQFQKDAKKIVIWLGILATCIFNGLKFIVIDLMGIGKSTGQ